MKTHDSVNVLLVEDDDKAARHVEGIMRGECHFMVQRVSDLHEAERALQQSEFAVTLLSLELAGQPGLGALAVLQAVAPRIPVIAMAADEDETLALKAVHQGAADYLIRSHIYPTVLVRSLKHAVEYGRAEQRKRLAEEALMLSELRYRSLFEQSRDAIFLTDIHGIIVESNLAMLDLLKCTSVDLEGARIDAIFADAPDRLMFEQEYRSKPEINDFEVRIRRKDGHLLWCLMSMSQRQDGDSSSGGYQGILHDITDRKQSEQRLLYNAYHDILTGLPNRALFTDRLDRALVRWSRHREDRFAVMFIDLNRFKVINDSLGHSAGDELLRQIGKIISNCVREEDTVARLGGDEYAILVERLDSKADPVLVAHRIHACLEQPLEIGGQAVYMTCSIGIALPENDTDKAEDLLRNADIAMYKSKAAGPAMHTVYVPGMHSLARTLMELDMDLHQAVRGREFLLHYQPIYDLDNNTISGFEALLRWQHPRRGLLLPHEFIPLAEETGLIIPIGSWVIDQVCTQIAEWQRLFPKMQLPFISLNVAGSQITRPEFVRDIGRSLRSKNVRADSLMFELTETSLLQNPESCAVTITKLRNVGIRFCIDDFGTGYSSLSYLHRLPINGLKIDRSFISALDRGESTELVSTIVTLAHSLGLYAVAEGVETEQQLSTVRGLGPRYVQGYYFSHPVEAAAAQRMLLSVA